MDDKRARKSINTRNRELFHASDLHEWYQQYITEPILASLEEFQERDSGWALIQILNLTINVNKYNPLRAGCHFKLPREIMLKRATINIQSSDNTCFAWAVVAALHPAKKYPERPGSYPQYTSVLNLHGIEFPMSLKQIEKFELQNNISINVYSFSMEKNGPKVFPLRLTSQKRDRHANLLYTPEQGGSDVGHFVWIKDLSRLVGAQLSRHKRKKYFCDRCMHYFDSAEKLDTHTIDCREINNCAILLPSQDSKWLSFDSCGRKGRLPVIIYADLEYVLLKTVDTQKDAENHKLCMYQKHENHSRLQIYESAIIAIYPGSLEAQHIQSAI
ncbi:uncharacterized protein LOC122404328 [Colletes gigas]|uniref:uncharacterized protein LOC122404328 n=1 Tax=Colletes gigas TaxID=935657 RepID=UPI001C9B028E|nr:uncharacterized protein LOC122404328 [Colletes gigas]